MTEILYNITTVFCLGTPCFLVGINVICSWQGSGNSRKCNDCANAETAVASDGMGHAWFACLCQVHVA